MPNWCFTSVNITASSKKQAKKIYELLINEHHPFDFDDKYVDYNLLNNIDNINMKLTDDEYFKEFNKICEENNVEPEDFIKKAYKVATHNIYYDNRVSLCTKLEELVPILLDVINRNKEDKEAYIKYLKSNRIVKDNPLSIYRPNILEGKTKYDFNTGITSLDDWYNDRINKLGTKWHPTIVDSFIIKNEIHISLECAWGPCLAFFKYLSLLFVCNIEIYYEEYGEGFLGKSLICDGKETELYYIDDGSSIERIMTANDYEKEEYDFEQINEELLGYDIEVENLSKDEFIEQVDEEFDLSEKHMKVVLNHFYPKKHKKIKIKRVV